MKKYLRVLSLAVAFAMMLSLTACGGSTKTDAPKAEAPKAEEPKKEEPKKSDKLVVGFSQIGAESEWRTAETNSIKSEAEKLGIDLKFADAQQKQENQIKALRTFIAQKVDVIGIAPVVETGWDTVFQEAKDAKIPIIFLDRKAKCDESLYATFIGSDFIEEGKNAAKEIAKLLNNKGNVVELEGTVGASAATDRKKGFDDEIKASFPDIKIIKSQTGDFTRAKGKEVMESWLKSDKNNIQAVYAHNDDMALGAIQAIEEAGLKPGTDIKIVSIDGVKGAFEAMVAGKLNVTVECNPCLGPQFFEAAKALKEGKQLEKWVKSKEGVFRMETAKEDIKTRTY